MKQFFKLLILTAAAAALLTVTAYAKDIWNPAQNVFTNLSCLVPGDDEALVLNDDFFYLLDPDAEVNNDNFAVTVTFKRGEDLVTHGFYDGRYVIKTLQDYNRIEDGVYDMQIDYIYIKLRGDLQRHITLTSRKISEVTDGDGNVIVEEGVYLVIDELYSSDGKNNIPERFANSYGDARFDIGYPVAWTSRDAEAREHTGVLVNSITSDYTVVHTNYTSGESFGYGVIDYEGRTTPIVGNAASSLDKYEFRAQDTDRNIYYVLAFSLKKDEYVYLREQLDRSDTYEAVVDDASDEWCYIDFEGTPTFKRPAQLGIDCPSDWFIYEYVGGELKTTKFKYDESISMWTASMREIGDYIASPVELLTSDSTGDSNPDTGLPAAALHRRPLGEYGAGLLR